MWTADKWKDYELIDTSDGERLERWGKYILRRPDPQVVWNGVKKSKLWNKADAVYAREGGGGSWTKCDVPPSWNISYGDMTFKVRPMGFKHTGLFPEQAVNWDRCAEVIKQAGRKIKVLNLFAYTGGASVAAAKAGAEVYHVDAAKNMVAQAKENAEMSGVSDSIRFFVDDCTRFLTYAKKRGITYDAVIMDPPSYGRGPSGEVWKLEECVGEFISLAADVLSDKPLFFLVNSYTTGISPSSMGYMLDLFIKKKYGGSVSADEIGLPVTETGAVLPCGGSALWTAGK
ncbi:MAG: class I SAM-dependent methyltransferase [Clostridia bacterium]|nr:class I SAM-dependent methyltransferase [Clostridia bacterium]